MGVAAILTSDLFRLKTTLDAKTQTDLDRQRVLGMKEELTPEEEAELGRIRDDLRGRGFDFTIRDPLYQEFLKAWTAQEDPAWRDAVELTPKQREDRGKLAARIVEELRREAGSS
jgi:hypothetical protein